MDPILEKMKNDNSGPYLIDIGFLQLVQEYVQAGDLISKRKFGLYPNDLEKSLRQNFSCVGDGVEFRALEKECLVRFRGTDLQVTVKSLFFRGAYVNTSFAIMPGKVKLAYLLELLAAEYGPLNVRTSRVLFFGGIDEGVFVHRGLLIFRFGLSRQKFHLTTIETAYAENEASKKIPTSMLSFDRWIGLSRERNCTSTLEQILMPLRRSANSKGICPWWREARLPNKQQGWGAEEYREMARQRSINNGIRSYRGSGKEAGTSSKGEF